MAFAENKPLDMNEDPANPGDALVGSGAVMDVAQMSEKGYEIVRGVGAAIAGNIEGSVAGGAWTVIASIAASAQGVVPVHYNKVRLTLGTGGAINTVIKICGKVL